jgi:hypothetical protein
MVLVVGLFIAGCSKLPAEARRTALGFVRAVIKVDDQMHAWEFQNLRVVCANTIALTEAQRANGGLEGWCVVVRGIGREMGKAEWLDIERHVVMLHVRTSRGPVWWPVDEEEDPCSCKGAR